MVDLKPISPHHRNPAFYLFWLVCFLQGFLLVFQRNSNCHNCSFCLFTSNSFSNSNMKIINQNDRWFWAPSLLLGIYACIPPSKIEGLRLSIEFHYLDLLHIRNHLALTLSNHRKPLEFRGDLIDGNEETEIRCSRLQCPNRQGSMWIWSFYRW